MKLLMIGHLIGDFYLQSNQLAEDKKTSLKALRKHVLLYVAAIYVVMLLGTGSFTLALLPVAIIGITHGIIDYLKVEIMKKRTSLEKYEWIPFMVDQAIHMSILYAIDCVFNMPANFTWMPDNVEMLIAQYGNILTILIAILLCGKPSAIVVTLLFKMIPKTMSQADQNTDSGKDTYKKDLQMYGTESQSAADNRKADKKDLQMYETKSRSIEDNRKVDKKNEVDEEEIRIGSWIGILEREIMLILGLMGQFGAIGFVLTAKSLARYKQLENKAFAEKYLVGTLLSSFIALLCICMCSML